MKNRSRPGRLGIWALLVGLLAALGLPGVTPAHAADSAVDVYGGCLVAEKAGDILLVIDETASLNENDPDNNRVTSAKYLLTQLNSFAKRANVTLDVSVAGFSHHYVQAQDWTALDDSGLKKTLETVDSFADLDKRPYGWETDYWMALEGSRRALAEHNPDGDRCQALVWITDGSLDLDARRTPELVEKYGDTKPYLPDTKITTDAAEKTAEAEAERQICRDGGLADQLRSSGITVFGVGLRGEEKPDYTLLKSISLGGDAGGQKCGKITDPPGSFTEAADIDELLFEFDRFATPNQERKDTEGGVCQGDVCPEERHTFVLDDSVQSVHILGSSDVAKAEVYLVTPQGEEIKLDRGTIGDTTTNESGGVKLEHSWQSEHSVVIDMSAAAGSEAWAGPWSVVFVDPTGQSPNGKSRTSIAISGDVFPTWPEADQAQIRSGEMNQIQLGLVNADGDSIDPTKLLGKVDLNATLRTPDGQEIPVAQGLDGPAIAAPIDLDLTNVAPGKGTLVLSLSITTKDATDADGKTVPGTELEPQSVRIPVQIVPPPGYPTISGQVNFGSLEGRADGVSGELTVTGPGCVWVEGNGSPNMLAGPENLGNIAITSTHNSAETCLEVPEGQSATLPVQLTTDGVDNGTLNTEFTVRIAPIGELDRVQDATASATANFAKPLNPVNFTLTLIVAALLGPGIPLGLLYLLKFLTAKIPGRALLGQEFPVQVEAGQVIRDGGRFELKDRDLTSGMVPLAANGSRTAQAASATLTAKMGGSPFGEGHVRVETPGRIGASSSDTRPRGKESYARLPLNVHNHWVLLHDPNGPATSASVLLLVGADAPDELREKLVDDINARVPDVLDAMRMQVGASSGGDGGSPFGGPEGGPGGPQPGGPAPFDFGPDMGGPAGPNPFGEPSAGGPFGGPAPAGAPSPGPAPAGVTGTPSNAPASGPATPASAQSAGAPTSSVSASPHESNPFGANPFGGDGPNPYAQQAQQAAPQPTPPAQPPVQPSGPPSADPQQSAAEAPQPAPQAPWGQQAPQAAPWEQPQQAPSAPQPPWGQPPVQEQPPGQGQPPVEGQQAESSAQPPSSGPSAAEQFRPEAPPAGTQIRNPFEFGDNSGR